jgi:phosphopantetheine--protein transferase-like protein
MLNKYAIGNDIIDLKLSDKQVWRQKRFLDKIFTTNEFQYFKPDTTNDFIIELLFSCKESAYKYFVKQGRERAFNPHSFSVCELINRENHSKIQYSGIIECDQGNCKFISEVNPSRYVHSLCFTNDCSFSSIFIKSIGTVNENSISEIAGLELKHFISGLSGIDESSLELVKDQITLIPYIAYKGRILPFDISISHDGEYIAVAATKTE